MINNALIRELRLKSGKSQKEMGAWIGGGTLYYEKRERGYTSFSAHEMWRLAQLYGVKVDELYIKD